MAQQDEQVSRFLYFAAGIVSVAGILYGYNMAVIAGAILFIRSEFDLGSTTDELLVGAVLFGALLGAGLGGGLVDRVGRRTTLMISGITAIAGAGCTALAPGVAWLFVGRLVTGAAIGLTSFTGPLYLSEIAPGHVRGRLVSVFTVGLMLAVLLSYMTDFALAGDAGWRWMLGIGALPGLLLCLGVLFLPESPRWLVRRDAEDAARAALERVRGTGDVDDELARIRASTGGQSADARQLWGALRAALIVGVGVAIIRQATGIAIATFYAPTIFVAAGVASASVDILAAVAVGVTFVLMTVLAMVLVDRLGRRPLMLIGLAGMASCLGVLGLVFDASRTIESLVFDGLALASLMLFVAMWSIGPGAVSQLVIAEIYPLTVRGVAMGIATAFLWGAYLLTAATFLTLSALLGEAGTFWLFGLSAVVAWAFVYRYVPETKGRTLEEIEAHWRLKAAHD